MRAALAAPISFGDREVSLTASIGFALFDPSLHAKGADLFGDAEIALANAKKEGGDRAVPFERDMRAIARDARRAGGRSAAGARSAARSPCCLPADRAAGGSHRRRLRGARRAGAIRGSACWAPAEFFAEAESAGVLAEIGVFALDATARELAAWQKALEVTPPIFASLNISSRQMLGHDLLTDLRAALNRHYRAARHAEAGDDREPS